jgi:hypothetical protein
MINFVIEDYASLNQVQFQHQLSKDLNEITDIIGELAVKCPDTHEVAQALRTT